MFNTNHKSYVYSPFSIHYLLTIFHEYTNGITREEFNNAVPAINNVQSVITKLRDDNVKLVTKNYIEKTMITDLKTKDDYVVSADFMKIANKEVVRINDTIANETKDLIPNFLSPSIINNDTRMVLLNVLYFKMKWQYPFNKSVDYTFLKYNNENISVKMMRMEKEISCKYFENNDFQAIYSPYNCSNNTYIMVIVKPKNEFVVMDQNGILNCDFRYQVCEVKIPKFTTEFEIEFNDALKSLNLNSMFNLNCVISNLIDRNDLFVDKVIQKAKIIVDETGTEAAAVTAAIMHQECCRRPIPSVLFDANKTFQYYIMHDDSKTTLFSGVFNG